MQRRPSTSRSERFVPADDVRRTRRTRRQWSCIAIAESKRGKPKGRAVDAKALAEVRALLGDAPRRRDLLIEHLHRIQDRYGHLSAAHLVALAREMKLAPTEVYEVATFYHHFDVVKEGDAAPPPLTVRVCDSLSCEMAGAQAICWQACSACWARACA